MQQTDKHVSPSPVPGYHVVTRWLHAGLILGVIFQLTCAALMADPEHAGGGHGGAVIAEAVPDAHHPGDAGKGAVAHTETVVANIQQPDHKRDACSRRRSGVCPHFTMG